MRILGGKLKGRQFHVPKMVKTRPTTDFAKEGLFSILTNTIDITTLEVLDLFSGTGSISYEFGSRAVKKLIAVEKNLNNFQFIKNTL